METSPTWFSWLMFFVGGAVGATVVSGITLGLERYLNRRSSRNNFNTEKQHVLAAFGTECDDNLRICETIIAELKEVHHSIFAFSPFSYLWLDVLSNRFINFTSGNHLQFYSHLYGARSLMQQIQIIQDNQLMLSATSRALVGFTTLANQNNQSMLRNALQLKKILGVLKELEKHKFLKEL